MGAKLAGRAGGFNVGLLNIQQDRSQTSDSTNLTVARISRNVLEESTLGFIATHGDPLSGDKNALGGADFNYRNSELIENRVVAGNLWYQNTFSGDDDYDHSEKAWGARIVYPNDRINWQVAYRELDDEFDPALGFVNRRNIRRIDGSWRHRHHPAAGRVRTVDSKVTTLAVYDRVDDALEGWNVIFTPAKVTTHYDDSISLDLIQIFDKVEQPFFIVPHVGLRRGKYTAPSALLRIATSPNRPLRFNLTVRGGGFYDGQVIRVNPFVEWRPSEHFLFSFEWNDRWWLNYRGHNQVDGAPTETTRQVDFLTRTARLRVVINFTPDASWSTVNQYDNFSNQISAQSIFRWIIEEGNDVYLVLGQTLDATPHAPRVGRNEPIARVSWTYRF